jgi:hypothetical protein
LTDDELMDMIEYADSNADGIVSLEDFYNLLPKKIFP